MSICPICRDIVGFFALIYGHMSDMSETNVAYMPICPDLPWFGCPDISGQNGHMVHKG